MHWIELISILLKIDIGFQPSIRKVHSWYMASHLVLKVFEDGCLEMIWRNTDGKKESEGKTEMREAWREDYCSILAVTRIRMNSAESNSNEFEKYLNAVVAEV